MQSSFTVFCRALVMLTCLVVLPLAAITGGTGRRVIVPFVERCLDLLRERPVQPVERALGPLPLAAARGGRRAGGEAAGAVGQQQLAAASGGKLAAGTADGVYPAGWGSDQAGKPFDPRLSQAGLQGPQRRPLAGGLAGQSVPEGSTEGITGKRATASAGSSQRVIEQRLRDLGATYYTLERWGSSQRIYRFECRMAITADPNYTRFFEATSERPLGAMANVLRQVEAWRADRQVR